MDLQLDIYLDDEDRLLFIDLLAKAIAEYHWILHAYVVMTNHFQSAGLTQV